MNTLTALSTRNFFFVFEDLQEELTLLALCLFLVSVAIYILQYIL